MLKMALNRAKRTVGEAIFYVAPVWHLKNLRREAYDQIEDLHYQVGFCRANLQQLEERLAEIDYELTQPGLDPQDKFILEGEKRQLAARLAEARVLEEKAREVVEAYKEALPKLVGQLDMAIQMTRLNRTQRSVVKALGSSQTSDGDDVQEHITKVRATAYALAEQLNGQLALGRMRKRRLIGNRQG